MFDIININKEKLPRGQKNTTAVQKVDECELAKYYRFMNIDPATAMSQAKDQIYQINHFANELQIINKKPIKYANETMRLKAAAADAKKVSSNQIKPYITKPQYITWYVHVYKDQ